MRKVIIGVLSAAAAFVANAAYVNWSVEGICTSDGDAGASGYMAYLLVDSGAGFTGDAYTRASAISAIQEGSYDFLETYGLVGDWGSAGVGVDGGMAEDYNIADGSFVNDSTDVKSYLVIVNAGDLEEVTKAFVTELAETPIKMGEGSPTFDVSGTANPNAWIGTAAPEPTSGLLLLLGMAGLALRRRRA